jgi:hypothetical protein
MAHGNSRRRSLWIDLLAAGSGANPKDFQWAFVVDEPYRVTIEHFCLSRLSYREIAGSTKKPAPGGSPVATLTIKRNKLEE